MEHSSGAVPGYPLQVNKPLAETPASKSTLKLLQELGWPCRCSGHIQVQLWHSDLHQNSLLAGFVIWHSERDFHLPREIKFHENQWDFHTSNGWNTQKSHL